MQFYAFWHQPNSRYLKKKFFFQWFSVARKQQIYSTLEMMVLIRLLLVGTVIFMKVLIANGCSSLLCLSIATRSWPRLVHFCTTELSVVFFFFFIFLKLINLLEWYLVSFPYGPIGVLGHDSEIACKFSNTPCFVTRDPFYLFICLFFCQTLHNYWV